MQALTGRKVDLAFRIYQALLGAASSPGDGSQPMQTSSEVSTAAQHSVTRKGKRNAESMLLGIMTGASVPRSSPRASVTLQSARLVCVAAMLGRACDGLRFQC